jgi:tetratricopeptide (TPR) repeat protein
MSGSPFIPRAYQTEAEPVVAVAKQLKTEDTVGSTLLRVQQWIVGVLMFFIPVAFAPGLPASLGFDKALVGTVLSLTIIVLVGLSALRYQKTETVFPRALVAFWIVVLVGFISAALSGDILDAVRGSVFESQTAAFLAVMGLLMSVPLVLQKSKKMSMRVLIFFGAAASLVLVYCLSRIIFGATFLPLSSFSTVTVTPIGSFNDLAIFSGLSIIIALITLLQLPLRRAHQLIIGALILVALVLMAVVNFFTLWLIVGFFALLLLVYIFSKDTLFSEAGETRTQISPVLIAATMIVCVTSIVFVVAGDYVGSKINTLTGISYLEVRPSLSATLDITKKVYGTDVFLGIGPNKFIDAWRLHKDQTINETLFWNTNFNAGYGFTPTLFVTFGILGGLAILAFQVLYIQMGYRMLLRGDNIDSFWYYFGLTTFFGALFLWVLSYVYVIGPAILLLAALFTGLSFVAYAALVPQSVTTVSLVSNRRRGFLLMVAVIVVIIVSVAAIFTMAKQYVAQTTFTKARTDASSLSEFQQLSTAAYQQYQDETFLLGIAQARLIEMQSMLGLKDPTEQDQERFIATAKQAVLEAEEAIKIDEGNPVAHAMLADIYTVLAIAGFQDAPERVTAKLQDARFRDPLNPVYAMAEASLAVRLNDSGKAREKIVEALGLKRSYPEALFLLTQIDVKDGKVDDAITTARQIITLEPNNPTRYYQLGLLYAGKKDLPSAITAYEAAISRDSNFANARYMLALAYLDSNRVQDGLAQLRTVRDTNQDNKELTAFISQIETSGYTPNQGGVENLQNSVAGAAPEQNGDNVTSPTSPDTDLVSPVNTVGTDDDESTNPSTE